MFFNTIVNEFTFKIQENNLNKFSMNNDNKYCNTINANMNDNIYSVNRDKSNYQVIKLISPLKDITNSETNSNSNDKIEVGECNSNNLIQKKVNENDVKSLTNQKRIRENEILIDDVKVNNTLSEDTDLSTRIITEKDSLIVDIKGTVKDFQQNVPKVDFAQPMSEILVNVIDEIDIKRQEPNLLLSEHLTAKTLDTEVKKRSKPPSGERN